MSRGHNASSPTHALASDRKRDDQLNALIDHCSRAQLIADTQCEKFLSYMLAMTIQAAQSILRARRPG